MHPRGRVSQAVERWGTDRVLRGIGATPAEAEHALLLHTLGQDDDPVVAEQADKAVTRLSQRIDLVDH